MHSLLNLAVLVAAAVLFYTWRQWRRQPTPIEDKLLPETGIESLKGLCTSHELRTEFLKLVRDDGAGNWPPRARHHDWPAALSAFSTVYKEVAPHLATAEPSLDDEFNIKRCAEFRARMRASLEQHVDADATARCLEAILRGDYSELSRDSFNGFYSCVACLRHAYRCVILGKIVVIMLFNGANIVAIAIRRWATNPVVRVAQNEKFLAFPPELDLAWSFIQKHLDITSPSGNIVANIICNFDAQGKLAYRVNEGMSDAVLQTELAWCRLFTDSESLVSLQPSLALD